MCVGECACVSVCGCVFVWMCVCVLARVCGVCTCVYECGVVVLGALVLEYEISAFVCARARMWLLIGLHQLHPFCVSHMRKLAYPPFTPF